MALTNYLKLPINHNNFLHVLHLEDNGFPQGSIIELRVCFANKYIYHLINHGTSDESKSCFQFSSSEPTYVRSEVDYSAEIGRNSKSASLLEV